MNELLRKFVHIGVVALLLGIGLVLGSIAVVAASAGLFVLFGVVRLLRLKTPLHNVPRISYGDLFLPIGIALAALMTLPGEPRVFAFALATLALADTAATLVGRRTTWGAFRPWGERKTVAGTVAFVAVALAIGLATNVPFSAAAVAASCAAVAEVCSPRGSDNITIPVVMVLVLGFFM